MSTKENIKSETRPDVREHSDETIKYWLSWPLTDDVMFNRQIIEEAKRRGLV